MMKGFYCAWLNSDSDIYITGQYLKPCHLDLSLPAAVKCGRYSVMVWLSCSASEKDLQL